MIKWSKGSDGLIILTEGYSVLMYLSGFSCEVRFKKQWTKF